MVLNPMEIEGLSDKDKEMMGIVSESKLSPETQIEKDKLEFKVLRPGDKRTTLSLTGKPIVETIGPNSMVIQAGESTGITLQDYHGYLFVDGIHIDKPLRRKGVALKLYDLALELAKQEGRKGLLSTKYKRNDASDNIWENFKKQGRVETIEINGDKYDVLKV